MYSKFTFLSSFDPNLPQEDGPYQQGKYFKEKHPLGYLIQKAPTWLHEQKFFKVNPMKVMGISLKV